MKVPRLLLLYNNDSLKLLKFSEMRKKLFVYLTGWFMLIIVCVAAFSGFKHHSVSNEIDLLQDEFLLAQSEFESLKADYNVRAFQYLEEIKIARVVQSVNIYLSKEQVDFWVKTIKQNGHWLLDNLNDQSGKKIDLAGNCYSFNKGVAFLLAVAALESDFKLDARSSKDAFGPMQLRKATARYIGLENRADPEENVYGGTVYMMHLLQKYYNYPDQLELALASYNAGIGRVKREWISVWGSQWRTIHTGLTLDGRFKETRNYVTTVIALTRLLSSGRWSDMDKYFWSNYRRLIRQTDYANIFDYTLVEAESGSEEF